MSTPTGAAGRPDPSHPVATSDPVAATDHYFTAAPAGAETRRLLHVELAGRLVTVQTAPGVFCPDRLDIGTAVLLREAPGPPPAGNLLDLGCGWGPVALTLGLRSPDAHIWALDVNERALGLASDNARRVGIARFTASTPDQVPPDTRFATIWSNPPIRVGKGVLHGMLQHWLPRLEPGGTAYLVVQKNLGADSLQRWVDTAVEGVTCGRLGTWRGFRVLSVSRDG